MKQDNERDPIFEISKDNHSILRLKQYSATKKMQRERKYDFTPEAALESFVKWKQSEIQKIEQEIETARALVPNAKVP